MKLSSIFQRARKGEAAPTELDQMVKALGQATLSTLGDGVTPAEREAAIKKSVEQFAQAVIKSDPKALKAAAAVDEEDLADAGADEGTEDPQDGKKKKPTDEEQTMKADLDALDAAISKRIEDQVKSETAALAKKLTDAEAQNAELRTRVAKAEVDRATELRVAKAEVMVRSTGQKPEAIAEVLKCVEGNEAASAAVISLVDALKKAQTEAGIFKAIGGDGGPQGEGQEKVLARAAELRKADPRLTEAQAIAKAARENPEDAFRSTRPEAR